MPANVIAASSASRWEIDLASGCKMIDRGQLELAQLTERLLASRDRPKRQWIIDRIGHIWSPTRVVCCLATGPRTPHVHAPPTKESIDAVASFSTDPKINVRIAVASAIGTPTVPIHESVSVLSDMLADGHPVVRSNAARWLSLYSRTHFLDDGTLEYALTNETYSVRWAIASSLFNSDRADRGWRTLRESMPRTDSPLLDWLEWCLPFHERFVADAELQSAVSGRLAKATVDDCLLKMRRDTIRQLVPRARVRR